MSTRMRSILGYIIYLITFILVITIGLNYQKALLLRSQETYEMIAYIRYVFIFKLVIGVIFALPHLIKNIAINGKWVVNWIKLLILGVPF